MTAEEAFLRLIASMVAKIPTSVTLGVVEKVDKENHTCDITRDGQPPLFNVRLNAVIDSLDSHLVAFPVVGSLVMCLMIDSPTNYLVVATTALESVSVSVGNSKLLIDENDITINGGKLGGMVKISELTSKLNELVNTFNSHTHQVSTTGSASAQTGTATATTKQATAFKASDYENKKVKQ